MQYSEALVLAVFGTLLAFGAGCEEPPQRFLEELFDARYFGIVSSGPTINPSDIQYELKPGIEREYAAREIAAYLAREKDARTTRHREGYRPALHPRDYWALVLADMKGLEMEVAPGAKGPDEENIQRLLREIGWQGKPKPGEDENALEPGVTPSPDISRSHRRMAIVLE